MLLQKLEKPCISSTIIPFNQPKCWLLDTRQNHSARNLGIVRLRCGLNEVRQIGDDILMKCVEDSLLSACRKGGYGTFIVSRWVFQRVWKVSRRRSRVDSVSVGVRSGRKSEGGLFWGWLRFRFLEIQKDGFCKLQQMGDNNRGYLRGVVHPRGL